MPVVKRFAPALLLALCTAPTLLAGDILALDPSVPGVTGVCVRIELPREFLLFDPDLPVGAECEPSLFVIALDAPEGAPVPKPMRLECTRLDSPGGGALVHFECAPVQLAAGAHELFLCEAGYAMRVEVTGEAQVVSMNVPEPVAVRLVPQGDPGVQAATIERIWWRVEAGPVDGERRVERPMCEARPASDGLGFLLLGCGGRLSIADPDGLVEFEQPAELLVQGPLELGCAWWLAAQE